MRTELVTEPGDPARPNEDFAALAVATPGQGGAVIVLDGVTPPREAHGCRHPVPWFVSRLGGALTELSVSDRDMTLPEVLSAAISRTAAIHAGTCDLSHPRTPQATVAVARWSDSSVEYLVLSDSALLFETPQGEVRAVLDDRLARVPREALRSAAYTDTALRNREGGFFTAAADPSVAARAVTGTLPRASVRALAALTDGATRWVDRFHAGDWTACLTVLREEGTDALIRRVRALEHEHATRTPPLRGKRHDDATAVYVEL